MKRVVSFGLFGLLLCHSLAYVLVLWSVQWQESHDLSARLEMYRTVDSMVEFLVPLHEKPAQLQSHQPTDGFTYNGQFYDVVNMDVQGDTLHILGYENRDRAGWHNDLLGFINDQFATESGASNEKTNHLLKNFLKEYSSVNRASVWSFLYEERRAATALPAFVATCPQRALAVHSPPPERV